MEELGGWALALPSDAVDADAAERAASEVEKKFGPIEVWVINAMTTILVPLWEITPAEYKRATEVTYLAFVYGTMAALKRMRQRDRGRSCYASAEPSCLLRSQARDLRAARIRSARSSSTIGTFGFYLRCASAGYEHAAVLAVPEQLPKQPKPLPTIYQPEVAARVIHRTEYHWRREVYVGYPTIQAI